MNAQRLLTVEELSGETGIPKASLYKLVAPHGDLACIRTQIGRSSKRQTHGQIRIQWSDWENWLARHRTSPRETRPASPRPASLNLPGADRYVSG